MIYAVYNEEVNESHLIEYAEGEYEDIKEFYKDKETFPGMLKVTIVSPRKITRQMAIEAKRKRLT